jgi:hypothetical protein
MKAYTCTCGARIAYMHDKHRWFCPVAPSHMREPRPGNVAGPLRLPKCTCGACATGARPERGAGHSDWCDLEQP